jgi:hypothetical protein
METTIVVLRKKPLLKIEIPTSVYEKIIEAIPANYSLRIGKNYIISDETKEWRSENLKKCRKNGSQKIMI